MAKRKLNSAELVAIWLYNAAREMGHQDTVREVIHRAAKHAAEIYAAPDEEESLETEDGFGVRHTLARFATTWDETEREVSDNA
jgi:hypothetical protein